MKRELMSVKRELVSVLIGAALVIPVDAEAQRGRRAPGDDGPGDRRPRVEKLDPIRHGGRVGRRAPRSRPHTARVAYVRGGPVRYDQAVHRYDRAVHRYDRAVYRAGRIRRPFRDARIRIRLDWGRAPIHVRGRIHLDRRLNPGELRRVIGHRTVTRIRRAGRRAGLRGAPRGRWIETRRHGRILVVSMDRVDVAELVDYDGDGRIDDAFYLRHDRVRRWGVHP